MKQKKETQNKIEKKVQQVYTYKIGGFTITVTANSEQEALKSVQAQVENILNTVKEERKKLK